MIETACRVLNKTLTSKYVFIEVGGKSWCLVFGEQIVLFQDYSLNRRYGAEHTEIQEKKKIWGGRPLKVNVTRQIEEQSGNKSAGNVKNKKTSSHSRGHGSPCVDVKVRYKVNSEAGAFESQLLYCSFWDSSHPRLYTSYEAMTGNVHYWLLLSLCRAFFLVLYNSL